MAESVMIAFDGMTVPLSLLGVLPKLLSGVALAFAAESGQTEQAASLE